MIDTHAKLSEVFEQLPEIDGCKPNYKWGNDQHLNQLLKAYTNDPTKAVYPLIYNVSNRTSQNEARKESELRLSLVIATRNNEKDLLNANRWATSYKNVLFPMVQNIVKCFYQAGIFMWDETLDLYEFPNYGNGKENKTIDIWDALRMDLTITIQGDRCIKTIKF